MAIMIIFTSCEKTIDVPVNNITYFMPNNTHINGEQYQNKLNEYVKKGLVGVSLAIDDPQKGFWAGAAGKACLETGQNMTKYHLQYSGSIPKMYTGAAIMLLSEDGLIDINAKMNQYLPKDICDKITNGNEITVYQLLTHSSGIINYVNDPQSYFNFLNNPNDIFLTPHQLIELLYNKKAEFKPSEKFQYSDSNFLLLAVMIDYIINGNHARFFQDRMFEPLGLEHTYYKVQEGYPNPPGAVNVYSDLYANGKIINITDVYDNRWNLMVGDDGMIASPYDYLLFAKNLFEENIVSQQSLDKMKEWHIKTTDDKNSKLVGLSIHSWRNDKRDIWGMGHKGVTEGTGGMVFYFPEKRVTIALFINQGMDRGKGGAQFYNLWAEIVEMAAR